jgi:hypothetical protein
MAKRKAAVVKEKQPETFVLEIDLDELLLDDLEVLDMSKPEKLPGGTMRPVTSMSTVLDVLDRVVVGGVRNRGFKGSQLMEVIEQVQSAIFSNINPVSQNGKN